MVFILKVPLYEKNIPCKIQEIITTIRKDKKINRCISLADANVLVHSRKNDEFRQILSLFSDILPDGMPSVFIGRLKGATKMERCYGPDFFKETLKATRDQAINHFFCGGKKGVAQELKTACIKKFSNNNIVGTFSPPFREMSDAEMKILADNINTCNTDILWIGISSPKQEKLAYRLSKFTNVHYIITVGAAFDFHTDKVKQAPRWIQKIALEWFFRLCVEPKRLYKRYLKTIPLFIVYNLEELAKYFLTVFKK